MINIIKSFSVIFFCLIVACNSNFTPKPRGYYNIELPTKKYQVFNKKDYPYSFEYPVYANIVKDNNFFIKDFDNNYWINIDFPTLNGKIYLSYKSISKSKLDKLIKDAFELTSKHIVKASGIEQTPINNGNHVNGIYFQLTGDVATANQFFLTDSTQHFLRGALYFNTTPNEDSLSIVNSFIKKDIEHLFETLKWNNNFKNK